MEYCDVKRLPDTVRIDCEDSSKTLVLRKAVASTDDAEVTFEVCDEGVSVFLSAQKSRVKHVLLRWNGRFSSGVRVLGDATARAYGNLEWRGIFPERPMPWYCLVNREKQTACYGVKVRPSAFCCWHVDGGGITLFLNVCNGSHGVELNGRRLKLCTVVSEFYDAVTPFEAGREFCFAMCTDGVFPKEKVYGSNNWYYAYGKSSQKEIEEDAEYLAELTEGLSPRPYMVVDDCWQRNLCAGPWDELSEGFTDMKALAESIADKNVKPGIWIRPLCFSEDGMPKEWIMRDLGNGQHVFDITVPEAREYVLKSFIRLREWGYKLIKFDYTTYDIFGKYFFVESDHQTYGDWTFADRGKTNAEIILEFYKDIKKASGDCVIIGCDTVSHLAAGIFEIQRTGDDTSGRAWEVTRGMGFNTLAFRMIQHNIFYTVDADCVGITEKIPWKYNRQWLKLLANSGTPLFISSKKGVADKAQIEEIKQAFKINCKQDDVCYPLNWQDTVCPDEWCVNGKKIKLDLYEEKQIDIQEIRY